MRSGRTAAYMGGDNTVPERDRHGDGDGSGGDAPRDFEPEPHPDRQFARDSEAGAHRSPHGSRQADTGTVPASEPWPAHHRIGSFEIVQLLRAGDAGNLYRAWDHALARPVILDEFLPPALAHRDREGQMRPSLPAAAPMLERAGRLFVDEARVLARAEHPALARVLHLVEAHGTAFRVLPGYAGRPLSDLLADGAAPQDEAALRRLLDDVLGALDAWHAAAGAHGGVSAAQLMWLDSGHALLLGPDAASHTPLGNAAGTAARPAAARHAGDGGTIGRAAAAGLFDRAAGGAASRGGADEPALRAADLHALAQLVRLCMLGPGTVLPAGLPLADALQRARADSGLPLPHYSAAFLQTLDAALSPDSLRRPAHAAQFRQWLARGLEAAPASVAAAVSGAAVPASRAEFGAARAGGPVIEPGPGIEPAFRPVEVPAAAAPPAGAEAGADGDVDAATSALIRSVVNAIPDRPPRRGSDPADADAGVARAGRGPGAHGPGGLIEPDFGALPPLSPAPAVATPDEAIASIASTSPPLHAEARHPPAAAPAAPARQPRRLAYTAVALVALLVIGFGLFRALAPQDPALAGNRVGSGSPRDAGVVANAPTESATNATAGGQTGGLTSGQAAPSTALPPGPTGPQATDGPQPPPPVGPDALPGPPPAQPETRAAVPPGPGGHDATATALPPMAPREPRESREPEAPATPGALPPGGQAQTQAQQPQQPPQQPQQQQPQQPQQPQAQRPQLQPPQPQQPARTATPALAAVTSPRQQCGERTEFSLYRCMQQQCAQARWRNHAQCVQLRQTDRVPG